MFTGNKHELQQQMEHMMELISKLGIDPKPLKISVDGTAAVDTIWPPFGRRKQPRFTPHISDRVVLNHFRTLQALQNQLQGRSQWRQEIISISLFIQRLHTIGSIETKLRLLKGVRKALWCSLGTQRKRGGWIKLKWTPFWKDTKSWKKNKRKKTRFMF